MSVTAPAPVPHSRARFAPALPPPPGACDAHLHIQDDRFAALRPVLAEATVRDYRKYQALIGTQRAVVVQSRPYGTDNRIVLDAIAQLGPAQTRGVAVIRPGLRDKDLEAMHQGGIRGIRFSLFTPEHAAVDFSMVAPLSEQIRALGWHVQLHWTAMQIVEYESLIRRLRTPIVFDHFARIPVINGPEHRAFALIRDLVLEGRAWVKLSGAYLVSRQEPYADLRPLARALTGLSPQRMLWGSDWPHTTETATKPDDTLLFDLLGEWTGSEAIRHQVLVDNPAVLYGFGA